MASMKFHGFVVATMYGVPCFVLMPTAKNRYLADMIGRRDLLSHYGDKDLPDRLAAGLAPIDRRRSPTGCGETRSPRSSTCATRCLRRPPGSR